MTEYLGPLPDPTETLKLLLRLLAAIGLAAVIGAQRQSSGKPAGVRTHMLVALGGALFVTAAAESGMAPAEMSRVMQGIVTGIGFIGAGSILKHQDDHEIEGLTTAAGIWVTAGIGVAAGLGHLTMATIAALLMWATLALATRMELRASRRAAAEGAPGHLRRRRCLYGGRTASEHEKNHGEDDAHDEHDPRDLHRQTGDSTESQHGCDERDHEKRNGPTNHLVPP